MAAIQEPKKPMTSYFLYVQENREKVSAELGTKDFGPVTKMISERWKSLPANAKATLEKKAADLKADYQKALATFKEAGGVAGAKRKEMKDLKAGKAAKRAKKESEADKPKRPAGGGYGCFIAANRAEISKSLPAGSPCTAVSKVGGERWKACSAAEKAKYEAMYQTKKAVYEKEMLVWKAAKGASDDGDEDEEEEDEELENQGSSVASGESAVERQREAEALQREIEHEQRRCNFPEAHSAGTERDGDSKHAKTAPAPPTGSFKRPTIVGQMRNDQPRARPTQVKLEVLDHTSDEDDLMALVEAGLLDYATLERNISVPIAKGSQRNATQNDVELKDRLFFAGEIRRVTGPHFLRRLEEEVLTADGTPLCDAKEEVPTAHGIPLGDAPAPEELPSKTDVVLWLNLTDDQLDLYDTFLQEESVQRVTIGNNGMGAEASRSIKVLTKITNHPLLCLPEEEFYEWRRRTAPSSAGKLPAGPSSSQAPAEAAPAAAAMDMDDYDDDCEGGPDMTQAAVESHDFLARLRALVPGSVEGAVMLSCKLRVLSVLLPQLQKRGHRCLLFSHSERMLDLITACVLQVLGLTFLRINDTMEAEARDSKLDIFQAPDSRYFCMCLSAQVGGVGLTTTGADRVILCDQAWSPAMDAQAMDHLHRIGHKKDVVVYRLIVSGAIEDNMSRLQVFKRSLAETAMEQESQIRVFSKSDLTQLFEAPNQSKATCRLLEKQFGRNALETDHLLSVVAGDIGCTDDPDAMPFWEGSDVGAFSDYSSLLMYLEQMQRGEEEEKEQAKNENPQVQDAASPAGATR